MAKVKKKKGIVRFEAIVPFAIVCALIVLYFVLFFDLHLRKGIEWAGSYLNGAEVNVGSLKTSFINASVRIGKIEVTDKDKPEQNKVEIGNIGFELLWDALLRGKAVVNLAEIQNIQVETPRKSPGRVYPSESRSKGLEIIRSQISGTVLGDVARMLDGFDPKKALGEIGKLKSAMHIEQLKADLDRKEKTWTSALAGIPGQAEFSGLQQKLNSIQIGATKNPAEIQNQISQINGLLSEIDEKSKAIQSQAGSLSSDVNSFAGAVGGIDQVMKQDIQDLEKRIQLPKLDARSIASDLFGGKVVSQVAQVERYVTMARETMPVKKAQAATAKPVSPPRGKGKIYQFGKPNSYPLFWLRKGEISSRLENTALGGNVSGQLLDLSSSQPQLGKPMQLHLNGDFPKRGFMGIQLSAILDHTGEIPVDTLKFSAASFPIEQRQLSSSDEVQFAIAKAIGSATLEGVLKGDGVQLRIDTGFREVDYLISAKSKLLENTLKSVAREIPAISVQASLDGTWDKLGMSLQSNLASALEKGFAGQLQSRVAEARQQISGMVNAKVAQQRAELDRRYQENRRKITSQIDEKRKKADALRAQAMAKLDDAKKQLASKGLDGLRKKLPF
ncbi:MAG: hypothetical protein A2X94_10645 [Bdellovibrionales bacterium GWB1_55_8]|nr:MAG: hypothetical protein A2X94_10645 [Bdellovibrionales bacterium GWB1_55_8]